MLCCMTQSSSLKNNNQESLNHWFMLENCAIELNLFQLLRLLSAALNLWKMLTAQKKMYADMFGD